MINPTELQEEARKELCEEAKAEAKERLKGLFRTREKAALALKNIDHQIEAYLKEVDELTVYQSAGVDVSK